MAKNRDYTGLVRTPPSMAWLIGQRSRVRGAIDKLQALVDNAPKLIGEYQTELDAIDAVIPLHEVKVDPIVIKGRRAKTANLVPYGNMTRHILNYMREQDHPVFTDEIALHVAKLEKVDFEKVSRKRFIRQVGARLRALFAAGILNRHHPTQTRAVGNWSLRNDEGR